MGQLQVPASTEAQEAWVRQAASAEERARRARLAAQAARAEADRNERSRLCIFRRVGTATADLEAEAERAEEHVGQRTSAESILAPVRAAAAVAIAEPAALPAEEAAVQAATHPVEPAADRLQEDGVGDVCGASDAGAMDGDESVKDVPPSPSSPAAPLPADEDEGDHIVLNRPPSPLSPLSPLSP